MLKHTFILSFLFALSLPAISQTRISFKECSDAVNALQKFADAQHDVATANLLNHNVSQLEFDKIVGEASDVVRTYTLERCVKGQHTAVYQCFTSNKGDYSSCRK